MNSQVTRTPYNSIYEPLKDNGSKDGNSLVSCCLHGNHCSYGKGAKNTAENAKEDENQYVNLLSPSKEEKMASQLANKLSKLAADERKGQKVEVASLESLMTKSQLEEVAMGKDTGSKQRVEKKKKKKKQQQVKPAAEQENEQSYIMLGDEQSEEAVKKSTKEEKEEKGRTARAVNSVAASIYIGVCSPSDAEANVHRPTQFSLYHQLSNNMKLDTIRDHLPLIIVYKTGNSEYRHYPIRTTSSTVGDAQYFVDYGRTNVRKHYSLNHLVKYYQTHAKFDPKNNASAEIFLSDNE